jgi:hypothetical protein
LQVARLVRQAQSQIDCFVYQALGYSVPASVDQVHIK